MRTPNRSISIITLLVGLAASVPDESACAEASSGLPEQPNIILIVADDLGYGDLGAYGQLKVRTPVLDQLATEGIRFTDFYAGSTVCAPSRASLLTGLHSGHSPVRENPRWTRSGHPVDFGPEDYLFSEVLQEAGYSTAIIGKWGMAEDKRTQVLAANPAMPLQQGFDYFFGYRHHLDAHHYYWPTLYENNVVHLLEGNDYETNTGQYTHDLFTEKALEYVDGQSGERPFLLYLAYTIPHRAITVPDDSEEPYRNLGWPERKLDMQGHYKNDPDGNIAFAGMVSRMDRDIGRIRALLEEKGIDENTLILFTSDNGHEYDDGFFDSNGPLRGMKRDLYEGGIRVPTIAWWPGTVPPNTVSSHIGAFWDVLPTFCELARLQDCPASDGVSFLPTLLGNREDQAQHEFLYWEFNEKQGPIQAVRSGDWKLIRFLDEPPKLYDLSSDIGEEHDVAQKKPTVVQRLTMLLESARVEHPEFPLEWHPSTLATEEEPTWTSLFNGENLDGWVVKITGHPLGENFNDTYRVEDGAIKVSYDAYETFDGKFGNLYYKQPFSNYRLRLEYRFTGEQVEGGAQWALRNSGVMVHAQAPESMLLDQNFPTSIEVQFLGGLGDGPRPTGNLCTPGTNVVIDGQLVTKHCTKSSSATYDGDDWVTLEVEVQESRLVRHVINGDVVLEYSEPQLDPEDPMAAPFLNDGDGLLSGGFIALQAESHPVEFRNIQILELESE